MDPASFSANLTTDFRPIFLIFWVCDVEADSVAVLKYPYSVDELQCLHSYLLKTTNVQYLFISKNKLKQPNFMLPTVFFVARGLYWEYDKLDLLP